MLSSAMREIWQECFFTTAICENSTDVTFNKKILIRREIQNQFNSSFEYMTLMICFMRFINLIQLNFFNLFCNLVILSIFQKNRKIQWLVLPNEISILKIIAINFMK